MDLKTIWRIILTPNCWLRNNKTCHEWDKALNEALDKHGVQKVDCYTVKIGEAYVWVSNYPYSYGYSYRPHYRRLPTRKTVFRLHDFIKANGLGAARSRDVAIKSITQCAPPPTQAHTGDRE